MQSKWSKETSTYRKQKIYYRSYRSKDQNLDKQIKSSINVSNGRSKDQTKLHQHIKKNQKIKS